jgi:hypothetical protein
MLVNTEFRLLRFRVRATTKKAEAGIHSSFGFCDYTFGTGFNDRYEAARTGKSLPSHSRPTVFTTSRPMIRFDTANSAKASS